MRRDAYRYCVRLLSKRRSPEPYRETSLPSDLKVYKVKVTQFTLDPSQRRCSAACQKHQRHAAPPDDQGLNQCITSRLSRPALSRPARGERPPGGRQLRYTVGCLPDAAAHEAVRSRELEPLCAKSSRSGGRPRSPQARHHRSPGRTARRAWRWYPADVRAARWRRLRPGSRHSDVVAGLGRICCQD